MPEPLIGLWRPQQYRNGLNERCRKTLKLIASARVSSAADACGTPSARRKLFLTKPSLALLMQCTAGG